MRVLLVLLLLGLLILFHPCQGSKEINSTNELGNVVVIGPDLHKSSPGTPTPPVINPNPANPKGIVDPSKFSSPNQGEAPLPPLPSSNSTNLNFENALTQQSQYRSFQMNGSAEGNGEYAERSALDSNAGLSDRQTHSITKGDLKISSIIALYSNVINPEDSSLASSLSAALVLRDHLEFSGTNYHASQKYLNNMDYISSYFNTNRTLEDSVLYGDVSQSRSDILLVNNRSTLYNLGVGFIGTSRFHMKSNNSEISEGYNGRFALNMKLNSQRSIKEIIHEGIDDWLACPTNMNVNIYDEKGSEGLGTRSIFDYTYPAGL